MQDVVVIGAGIVGASLARELSKYELNVTVIEKESDVANGTTKANSAIVHGGYDPEENTLMAKYNLRGNEIYEDICKELNVPFKRIGALVIASKEEEKKTLEDLLNRGINNGVKGLKILLKDEVLKKEPNLNKEVKFALFSPNVGIVDPWELTIALIENATSNGVKLRLNAKVTGIDKKDQGYEVKINDKEVIKTKYVINAAGLYCDDIHNMVSSEIQKVKPVKGEYYIMDKNLGGIVNSVIFKCPSKKGKGVLIAPTVHGNLIVGPDVEVIENKEQLSSTLDSMNFVRDKALESVPSINFRESIRNFAGIRCYLENTEDFVVEEVKDAKGFIDICGIKSPGLTAAPAIAEDVIKILKNIGLKNNIKDNFNPYRRKINFMSLSSEEKHKLIKENPSYGKIICRCESITEGEIIDSIKGAIGATTVDGVKKRCRPGMGRCQGGFCMPRVQEIIARELNKDLEDIVLDKKGSYILKGKTKN